MLTRPRFLVALFFFFQAEDGIRDYKVTGVQTCALPISTGQDLVRSVTRNLLATMTPQPEDQWMMGGVESIQFSCYDGTTWYDTWDSTITTNLPMGVRVRILLTHPGGNTGTPRPIEMLVPIDSQSRTNQNASASRS